MVRQIIDGKVVTNTGDVIKVDNYNAQLVVPLALKTIVWDTDTDFNAGTFTNTEVIGTGESAVLSLENLDFNNDNKTYRWKTCSIYRMSI